MLENVKIRLGLQDTTDSDAVLNLMIEDAKQSILIYCNRKVFPAALEFVARELVVNAFNIDNGGNVASIKRGDTQINYASTITTADFTEKQMKMLNKFRNLRVG